MKEIVEDIHQSGDRLTTGSRLTGPLLSLLARSGQIDEAIALTVRPDYPSPYAMLSVTGGTIAENWGHPGLPARGNFLQAEGFSSPANWIYESLVGIAPTLAGPGFRRFILAPVIPASIPSCSFCFKSPQGLIETAWTQSGQVFDWTITVPEGAVAEATVPERFRGEVVALNGQPVTRAEFELGAGKWVIHTRGKGGRN